MRVLVICLLVGCSSAPLPDVRFANAPPVRVVDDRRNVPEPPVTVVHRDALYFYDAYFHRQVTRALELPGKPRALGVNAFDEVPDSTWFTNRIGVRDLSPLEIKRGPTVVGSPELYTPWTIVSAKPSGAEIGFIIKDTRGERFLLKLDARAYPEMESAAHVIVNRLLWAAGYNVPEDHVITMDPDELRIAPDAKFSRAQLAELLSRAYVDPSGRHRGIASRMLDGKVLGGHPSEGVRPGDPNDRIPHERRRELRGLYALFAWVDQLDAKNSNTLDVWAQDSADRSRRYVKHYFIDFGKSLGAGATVPGDLRRAYAYRVDYRDMGRSLIGLGLVERAWERRIDPGIRGVGLLEIDEFNPGSWKPYSAGYAPFVYADKRDKLWGAKLMMRFTPAQIRAAVDMGRYSDPRATEYVTAALIARQRMTARHWFERSSPLDRFAVVGNALCFDDLMLVHDLAPAGSETRYEVSLHDRRAARIARKLVLHAAPRGRSCMPLLVAGDPDGYTIAKIVARGRERDTTIYVHLARPTPTAPARVIGIWRP